MQNNFRLIFKIYFIVVNNRMQKEQKLEEDKILFKAIEEKKTLIKTKYNAFANFAATKSNTKPKKRVVKRKKEFVEWSKYKKCGCKYLVGQICKYVNKKYYKYYKKKHISYFHNSYIFLNKGKSPKKPTTSSINSKKNISYIIQVIANKIFQIGVI